MKVFIFNLSNYDTSANSKSRSKQSSSPVFNFEKVQVYESLHLFYFENSLSPFRKQSFVTARINVVRLVRTLADLTNPSFQLKLLPPCQGAIFRDEHFRPRSISDLRWLGSVEALTTYSVRVGLANIPSTIGDTRRQIRVTS